jgi:tRNA(Ile)-lysidine synthase
LTSAKASGIVLVRPLLDLPKARLLATLEAVRLSFADDPSNRDPRFTRPRLRKLMPALAAEGLDARRLSLLARRLRRADAVIEGVVAAAAAAATDGASGRAQIVFSGERFGRLDAEVALRLLGRAIAQVGDEGPVRLGQLEALLEAVQVALQRTIRLRRTLAGALVTVHERQIRIERAPPRSAKVRKTLTTRTQGARERAKRR